MEDESLTWRAQLNQLYTPRSRSSPWVDQGDEMLLLRRILLGAIAVAAVAVVVLFRPDPPIRPATADFERSINAAMSDYRANDALTDSAPQQQVVNGWVARDLLRIIADEQIAMIRAVAAAPGADERPTYLLALAVLAIATIGFTTPPGGKQDLADARAPAPQFNGPDAAGQAPPRLPSDGPFRADGPPPPDERNAIRP